MNCQHLNRKRKSNRHFQLVDLEEMEEFFDEFAKELSPFDIEFVQVDVFPSNVLGGVPSGCMSLRVKENVQLVEAQKKLNERLYEKFGPCPAEHDDDYIFHMTFAIGGALFEAYCKSYEELSKKEYNQMFRFNKIGLLYYDDDNITPGTYFCYKVCDI